MPSQAPWPQSSSVISAIVTTQAPRAWRRTGSIWVNNDDTHEWTNVPGRLAKVETGDFLGTGTSGLVGITADNTDMVHD